MARLREETADLHRLAERSPLQQALLHGRLPLETYCSWLGQRLLLHQRLEAGLQDLATRDRRAAEVVHPRQFQSENVRKDRLRLDGSAADPSPLPATDDLVGQFEAWSADGGVGLLGAHYVLEGSKNGARVLAEVVRKTFSLGADEAVSYLNPHGQQQGPLWGEFKKAMDAALFQPNEADSIVESAKATFRMIARIDAEIHSESAPNDPRASRSAATRPGMHC